MRYVLPGMGATSSMYNEIWQSLENTTFINWPKMTGEITFNSIAAELADTYHITADDNLVGSSLGGIIALEIANLVKCKEVILVGSAINKKEINQFLLALAPLSDITPLKFIQYLAGKSGGDLGEMFASVDAKFIRSTCHELGRWSNVDLENINIIRIHGSKDHVIKCPENANLIVNGGHLIAMINAQECVDFINQKRQ